MYSSVVLATSFTLLILMPTVVFAQLDNPGLVDRTTIDAGGSEFEVVTVANYQVNDVELNPDKKTLTFYIMSSLEKNIGEIEIPRQLIGGNLTFVLDGNEISPDVKQNQKISFVTLKFADSGDHRLDIIGQTYLQGVDTTIENPLPENADEGLSDAGGGCLIATATFDSELSYEVQKLRELRDTIILKTDSGLSFMTFFNQVYYSFSPDIADIERKNPLIKESVKLLITPMVYSLAILNYVDIDSDEKLLIGGVGVILVNIGMYVGLPLFGASYLRKRLKIT